MSAVSGIAELENVFKVLRKGVANRIARPGLAKAGRLAVKKIKAEIPSRFKGARKGIKSRSIKTKRNNGVAGVKIGVHVGQKNQNRGDAASNRKGKKGVGISMRNAHWIFAGTDSRWTGTKRVGGHKRGRKNKRIYTGGVVRFTGRMKPQMHGVTSIVARSKSEMVALIREGIKTGIDKEAARLAKKQL
jgi:hypothetical protein